MTVSTVCNHCGHITNHATRGYCPTCAPQHEHQRNTTPTKRAHRTTTHATIKRIVWNRDPHHCANCGTTHDLTLDYITPLARGGKQHSTNARILCRTCNSRKGAT